MGGLDSIIRTLTEVTEKYKVKKHDIRNEEKKPEEIGEEEIVVTMDNFYRCSLSFESENVGPWLREENMDVGGGTISIADIDKIRDFPNAKNVIISGLHQDTFEYFIKTYGKQFKAIFFHKNKLVNDWSLLGTLPDLEFVHWRFNQRIDVFWDMSQNTSLQGICIEGFPKLKSIAGIETVPNLKYFDIGDGFWPSNEIESLSPLQNTSVEYIGFGCKTLLDKDFSFIKNMEQLRKLELSPSMLTVEQYAWLQANCPWLDKSVLGPVRIDDGCVYTYGRGKRNFKLEGNEKRLKKVEEEFRRLVEKMKGANYPSIDEP